MNKRIKSIAIITSLLLFVGQLAALVHATDHPFHAPDEMCLAFTSLEKSEHAVAAPPLCTAIPNFSDDKNTRLARVLISPLFPSHHPRAPPFHT